MAIAQKGRQGRRSRGRAQASREERASATNHQPTWNEEPARSLTDLADVTQQAVQGMVSMWTGAAQEGLRLATQMQEAGMETVREMGTNALRIQTSWPEMLHNPLAWYQRTMEESVGVAMRGFDMARRNAEGVTQAVERIQNSAQGAGETVQRGVRRAGSRMASRLARIQQGVQSNGSQSRAA